jgi:aromatic ring-opening dioxygenase catalytic subunit (LigB family)
VSPSKRQPTIFLTHGGGPCFWMEFPEPFGPNAYRSLQSYLAGLLATLPERPQSILMVSAHWEEAVPTVNTAARPAMLYDYYGFPPHTYQLQYPAPGSPDVAMRAHGLLQQAGIEVNVDSGRAFDHGVFVPMLIVDPQATIPVAMLSLRKDLDAAHHLAMGAALRPLRDEGVLIIGSGSSFHNLRAIFDGQDRASFEFDEWLNDTVTLPNAIVRDDRLKEWKAAPSALACHPRAEHLIPLMVAAGAAGTDAGHRSFRDVIGGKAYSCFTFGYERAA